ncbi:MAG: hypothetical protein WDM85_18145 [Caulobacteraceae bacterium]
MKRLHNVLICVLLATPAGPAAAAVTVGFYSHPWGLSSQGFLYFPHAFITVRGTPDGGGEPVDLSFGFTAPSPTPALLFHRTRGEIIDSARTYMAVSREYFSIVVPDDRYRALLEAIAAWRGVKGDPYDLKKRNCITFVGEMGRAIGLDVGDERVMDPDRFLDDLRRRNLDKVQPTDAVPDSGRAVTPAAPAGGPASGPEAGRP